MADEALGCVDSVLDRCGEAYEALGSQRRVPGRAWLLCIKRTWTPLNNKLQAIWCLGIAESGVRRQDGFCPSI